MSETILDIGYVAGTKTDKNASSHNNQGKVYWKKKV